MNQLILTKWNLKKKKKKKKKKKENKNANLFDGQLTKSTVYVKKSNSIPYNYIAMMYWG